MVKLVECRPMVRLDEMAACCAVYDGAFSWILREIRRIKPFSVRGQLGLYDVELPSDIGRL